MMNRRHFTVMSGLAVVLPIAACGKEDGLPAADALAAMQDGSLILIDIRTPGEWAETGVAQGAWPLDMTAKTFGRALQTVIQRNPDRNIAVICRTGSRSGFLVGVLKENGIEGVLDVSEGMAGGRNGTGWIKSGLPIVSASEALAALPKDLTAR